MVHTHAAFSDPHAVAAYAQNARSNVPGLDDLHHMVMLLLAEHAPKSAEILVVGAGGGMETLAMARAQKEWRFTGIDPSKEMLNQAQDLLRPFADRVDLNEGTVDQLPSQSFDGATCLLTFHHIPISLRLSTLHEIHRRLKERASLVIVEHSAFGRDPQRWMALSAAFRNRDEPDWEKARANGRAMAERLPLVPPDEMESLLEEAGFTDVALFYAAFSFRGWVARAA